MWIFLKVFKVFSQDHSDPYVLIVVYGLQHILRVSCVVEKRPGFPSGKLLFQVRDVAHDHGPD